jgi:hypothetical protein
MFYHLRLGLPSCLYSSSFPITPPYILIISPIASHSLKNLLKYFLHNLYPSGAPVPLCLCSPRRERTFFLNVGRVFFPTDPSLCSTKLNLQLCIFTEAFRMTVCFACKSTDLMWDGIRLHIPTREMCSVRLFTLFS